MMISHQLGKTYHKFMDHVYDVHQKNIENLTKDQFKELIAQMISCGDITRHVVENPSEAIHRQSLTYVPYRDICRMQTRIDALEAEIERLTTGRSANERG